MDACKRENTYSKGDTSRHCEVACGKVRPSIQGHTHSIIQHLFTHTFNKEREKTQSKKEGHMNFLFSQRKRRKRKNGLGRGAHNYHSTLQSERASERVKQANQHSAAQRTGRVSFSFSFFFSVFSLLRRQTRGGRGGHGLLVPARASLSVPVLASPFPFPLFFFPPSLLPCTCTSSHLLEDVDGLEGRTCRTLGDVGLPLQCG